MVIYVEVNKDGEIGQWSTNKMSPSYIEVEIDDSHLFLKNTGEIFRYVNGEILKTNRGIEQNKYLKEAKKELLGYECGVRIKEKFPCFVKMKTYLFSYDQEAQINLQDTMRLFDNNMIQDIMWTAEVDGEKVRIRLNKEEFTLIYNESVKQKLDKISHFRDVLVPLIDAAETEEEINAVEWGAPAKVIQLNTDETL